MLTVGRNAGDVDSCFHFAPEAGIFILVVGCFFPEKYSKSSLKLCRGSVQQEGFLELALKQNLGAFH